MLGLLEGVALERVRDLGIALALRLTAHREVHADLRALAREVHAETLHDLLVQTLRGTDDVLARPGHLAFGGLLEKLGAGAAALRAAVGGGVAFVDVTADGANKLLHASLLYFLYGTSFV